MPLSGPTKKCVSDWIARILRVLLDARIHDPDMNASIRKILVVVPDYFGSLTDVLGCNIMDQIDYGQSLVDGEDYPFHDPDVLVSIAEISGKSNRKTGLSHFVPV